MRKLPAHLAAQDFPVSLSVKGERTWDVSKQVLANLSALGIEHLIAIGGVPITAWRLAAIQRSAQKMVRPYSASHHDIGRKADILGTFVHPWL
jgi:hypothetical protein